MTLVPEMEDEPGYLQKSLEEQMKNPWRLMKEWKWEDRTWEAESE